MAKRHAEKRPPFTQPLVAVLEAEEVTDREYRVYNAVLSFAWEVSGGQCTASVKSIAERAGRKCVRQTIEILQSLVDKGLLIEEEDHSRRIGRVLRIAAHEATDVRKPAPQVCGNPQSRRAEIRSAPMRKSAHKVDEVKPDEVKQMTMIDGPSSSSSSSVSLSASGGEEQEPNQSPSDPVVAKVLELAALVFSGPTLDARTLKLVAEHGAASVGKAFRTARQKQVDGRAVTWAYVGGILRNWNVEGGPSPEAKASPQGDLSGWKPPTKYHKAGDFDKEPHRKPEPLPTYKTPEELKAMADANALDRELYLAHLAKAIRNPTHAERRAEEQKARHAHLMEMKAKSLAAREQIP